MKRVIPRSIVHLARFDSPAVSNLTKLASEVQESLHCRICHRSVAAGDRARQRLESKAHAILNPDGVVQLRVKFRCIYCNAMHLAVPLPRHKAGGGGSLWARDDPAMDLVVRSLPNWDGFASKAIVGLTRICKQSCFSCRNRQRRPDKCRRQKVWVGPRAGDVPIKPSSVRPLSSQNRSALYLLPLWPRLLAPVRVATVRTEPPPLPLLLQLPPASPPPQLQRTLNLHPP